jgi:hypothetical protein
VKRTLDDHTPDEESVKHITVSGNVFDQKVAFAAGKVAELIRMAGLRKHCTIYVQVQGNQVVAGIGIPGASTPAVTLLIDE